MRWASMLTVLLWALGPAAVRLPVAQASVLSVPSASAGNSGGARRVVTYRQARPLINHRAETMWERNGSYAYDVYGCVRDSAIRVWCLVSYSFDTGDVVDAHVDAIYVSQHRDRTLWISDGYGQHQVTVTPEKP